ncbi:hypothetical protein HPP92_005110 [Vanilla planifolia]|uniref:Uncharacterized protein n=1 Tax=Vanilla planifolia TaxID=51239 RepID=A0A835RTF6_VANPL|nr:hypothetical protein HPP92_005110 [Vanilla planifolia]
MAVIRRTLLAPLLLLNFAMYIIVIGFASWCLNHFINGQSHYPGELRRVAGNGATFYFLVFSILAGVLGVASKLTGANHLRTWRSDSHGAAASSAVIAWPLPCWLSGWRARRYTWRIQGMEAQDARGLRDYIVLHATDLRVAASRQDVRKQVRAGIWGGQVRGWGGAGRGWSGEGHGKGLGMQTVCYLRRFKL